MAVGAAAVEDGAQLPSDSGELRPTAAAAAGWLSVGRGSTFYLRDVTARWRHTHMDTITALDTLD